MHLQVTDKRTFVRPIYAGNGLATVAVTPDQHLIMASVRVISDRHVAVLGMMHLILLECC